MGKQSEELPPSEALPGIGDNTLIFHNGKGYFYTCKKYSPHLDRRQYKCVRDDCLVTASMGPEQGSPLIDDSSHSHEPDLTYRDKCIVMHIIQQRFLQEGSTAFFILQDLLSYLSFEDNASSCEDYDVTVDDYAVPEFMKKEPYLEMEIDSIMVNEHGEVVEEDEALKEEEDEEQSSEATRQPVPHLYRGSKYRQQGVKKKQMERQEEAPEEAEQQQDHFEEEDEQYVYESLEEQDDPFGGEDIILETPTDITHEAAESYQQPAKPRRGRIKGLPQRMRTLTDKDGYMYCVNRTVGDKLYLRCSKFKQGCNARGCMLKGGTVEMKPDGLHNHQPDPKRVARREFTAAILDEVKSEARKDQYRSFLEIFNEMCCRYPNHASYVDYRTVFRTVKRAKLLY